MSALVLVVDDEVLLRMDAIDLVESAGFQAIEAADADKALAILAQQQDVRLLLTDIDMPTGSMNGLKLAAAARARWPGMAIIIVSGHYKIAPGELPEGALFLAKPYPGSRLVGAIQCMLA